MRYVEYRFATFERLGLAAEDVRVLVAAGHARRVRKPHKRAGHVYRVRAQRHDVDGLRELVAAAWAQLRLSNQSTFAFPKKHVDG